MDINRATIVGRLTRDPEQRSTQSGTTVTNFAVATNFVWNDSSTGEKKESVEYHDCVAWRKLGEIVGQYLKKGSRVLVEGRLQTRSWEGQDGVKRYRTEIIAENVIMLDAPPKRGGAGASGEPRYEAIDDTPKAQQKPQQAQKPTEETEEEEISVEDIPF